MGPVAKLFDFAHHLWWERARKRAWQNPEWAEIQRRRILTGDEDDRDGTLMLDDERGLTWADWNRQQEIFRTINPTPRFFRAGYWWRRRTRGWIFRPSRLRVYLQRARRGFSDEDTWSLDEYLSRVIADSVQRFAEVTNGRPGDISPEEWQETLAKIARGFRGAHRAHARHRAESVRDTAKTEFDEAFALLHERWSDLWW